MDTPLVSVIMSVYNGLAYLEQAVESILRQSFDDFEFIIVNDGSTEPVGELLSRIRDPRIVLIDQENMGLTRSLNKCISLARGKYLARMDADDVSMPQRLKRQVAAMEANPSLDLIASYYEVIDEKGRACDSKALIQDPVYRLWRLQFHNVYGHGTVLLRKRAIVAAGGYDETYTVAQDYELWSRISKRDNTLVIPEVLYQYRSVVHGPQSSVRHYETQLANAIRTSDRNIKACNPDFSDADCEDVRSVFWKFQRAATSPRGVDLLPALLEGFFARYGLSFSQRDGLLLQVFADVASEIETEASIQQSDRPAILQGFRKRIAHWLPEAGYS